MQPNDDIEVKAAEVWERAAKDGTLRKQLRSKPQETLMTMGLSEDEARRVAGKLAEFQDATIDPAAQERLKFPWRKTMGR